MCTKFRPFAWKNLKQNIWQNLPRGIAGNEGKVKKQCLSSINAFFIDFFNVKSVQNVV